MSDIEESAKAVQEVSKVAGKTVDGVHDLVSFFGKFVPTDEIAGIISDRFQYFRYVGQVKLIQKAEALRQKAGIQQLKPIALKVAIPYLEAAALEDDELLQDKWAALLVNAANPAKDIDLSRTYIAILEEITPYEAAILDKIYALPFEAVQHNGVWTAGLPAAAYAGNEKEEEPVEVKGQATDVKVVLALANLKRLGCIQTSATWGGGEVFNRILPTVLGKHFVAACTL